MIYGHNIRLRAVEREDLPDFVRWLNDPDVKQYLLLYTPLSIAQEERWFEGLAERTNDYVFTVDALIEDQWVHLGNTGLHKIDWKNRSAIFGIFLGEKRYWSQGYGTEVTRTILRFAFHELNLNRIALEVFAFNPRAIRAYEKAGFRHEGTRRQALFHDGQYHDAHWMAILRQEFER